MSRRFAVEDTVHGYDITYREPNGVIGHTFFSVPESYGFGTDPRLEEFFTGLLFFEVHPCWQIADMKKCLLSDFCNK